MSDEKKIEFSQSDVLNALLHQRNHEQHYATQDNVDNVKNNLARFEKQTDKQFESVEQEIKDVKQEIKDVKQEIKDVSSKLDKLLFALLAMFFAGFAALYFK